jgi:WD40 repeat protein
MRFISSLHSNARPIITSVLCLVGAAAAHGADTYNVANKQLTIASVAVGSAIYSNVVVGVGAIISGPAGAAANGNEDRYDPVTKQLTVRTVTVGSATYFNVVVTVAQLISIGNVTEADTYSGTDLIIPSVQVLGGSVYANVSVTVGRIIDVAGGMPAMTQDQYDPATKQLAIPAVLDQANNKVYTNAVISVGSILSVGAPVPAFVTVVSTSDGGVYGNSYSAFPSIGANGRYLTFQSGSTNLVPQSVQLEQIFLRDTCVGAPAGCIPTMSLVSVNTAGTASANAASQTVMAAVSSDGNSVVFASSATNVDPAYVQPEQTYLRDTCAAQASCSPSMGFSSVNDDGVTPPSYGSYEVTIDSSGRFTVQAAISAEYVGSQFDPIGVFNPGIVELYERDTCATAAGPISNCVAENVGISVTPGTSFGDSLSGVDFETGFSVSGGGRFVAFGSTADDLFIGPPYVANTAFENVYLRDTCGEMNDPVAGCVPQTMLISQTNSGTLGQYGSYGPSLSDDGRFVAFTSQSALAPLAQNGNGDVYVRDTCLAFTNSSVPGCTPSTQLISVNAAGTADTGGSVSQSQAISADGRFVAFWSGSASVTSAGTQSSGIFVRDRCQSSAGAIAGCTPKTFAETFDADGNFIYGTGLFALSADGHYLAFAVSGCCGGSLANQVVLMRTGF